MGRRFCLAAVYHSFAFGNYTLWRISFFRAWFLGIRSERCASKFKPRKKMKTAMLVLISCLCVTIRAQSAFNQQVISEPLRTNLPPSNGTESSAITNSTGSTAALGDLDAQLSNLKSDVERTLPMISAVVNQGSAGTTSPNTGQELTHAASNIIANAFGRSQVNTIPPGETSPRTTNFAGILRSLIRTNNNSGTVVGLDPDTLSQLTALQNHLQPVLTILNGLNVSGFP